MLQVQEGALGRDGELGLDHATTTPHVNASVFKHNSKAVANDPSKAAIEGMKRVGNTSLHAGLGPGVCRQFERSILLSLSFTSMRSRFRSVAEAHAETCSWIFKDPKVNDQPWDHYGRWLAQGNNIYWINGKAASGKSTLMKYLVSTPNLEWHLQQWSGHLPILCADFFFWNTGNTMQKSQAGLLRSLLHEVLTSDLLLEENECVIRRVMPKMWDRLIFMRQRAIEISEAKKRPFDDPVIHLRESWYSWTLSELKEAFEKLMQVTTGSHKFCFFIDGLDEFDGDHAEIVAFFKHIATFPHAKLCVSSRPLLVFQQEFAAFPKLRLQDLTRDDMWSFAHDRLSEHQRVKQLSQLQPELLEQLVTEVLDMSSGVFLWVELAVRSLLKGLANSDSIADLQRRLRDLPPELDDLYSLMLRSIQPKLYIEQASRLLQIVYQAETPITALGLSFADDADIQLPLKEPIGYLSGFDKYSRVEAIANRLNTRCAGLLELSTDDENPGNFPNVPRPSQCVFVSTHS